MLNGNSSLAPNLDFAVGDLRSSGLILGAGVSAATMARLEVWRGRAAKHGQAAPPPAPSSPRGGGEAPLRPRGYRGGGPRRGGGAGQVRGDPATGPAGGRF